MCKERVDKPDILPAPPGKVFHRRSKHARQHAARADQEKSSQKRRRQILLFTQRSCDLLRNEKIRMAEQLSFGRLAKGGCGDQVENLVLYLIERRRGKDRASAILL